MKFSEKLAHVVGAHPYSWAAKNGVPKGTMRSWLGTEHPQTKSLAKLVEKSGFPLEWWLDDAASLAPPAQSVMSYPAPIEPDVPPGVGEHPSLPPIEVRRMQGKINVDALTAIIEGALKTAPNAAPRALAEHCAKIYAQAIEAGLITPDGLGPGRIDKAA